jgi:hypothetical protein
VLFVYPMWDSENQRLGLQACTPRGYAIRSFGEFIGFCGLVLLLGTLVVVPVLVFGFGFRASVFWFELVPVGVGIVSECLVCLGWMLARRRSFRYDADTGIASWIDGGKPVTFQKYHWNQPSPSQNGSST